VDLLAQLRASPGDPGLREVVLDRWLEADDPRADWAAALRRGDPRADDALARLRGRLPGPPPRRVRAHEGFVVEVEWDLADFVRAPPPRRPLADHPLAIATIGMLPIRGTSTLPALSAERFQRALTHLALACGPVRGLRLEGIEPSTWPSLRAWIEQVAPRVLGLAFGDAAPIEPPADPWPSVCDVLLEGIPPERLDEWLAAVPAADRIALREAMVERPDRRRPRRQLGIVPALLAAPRRWREADLRGCDIRAHRAELAASGLVVRHPEGFGLTGIDPLDDPFGHRGEQWVPPTRTTRRAAVVPPAGDRPARWIQSAGRGLRWHLDDAVDSSIEAPAPITAVCGLPDAIAWGDRTGAIHRLAFDAAAPERIGRVDGAVLDLDGVGEDLVVLTADGAGLLRDGRVERLGPADHVAMTDRGPCWARGPILHDPSGELDVGDPIVALDGRDPIAVAAGGFVYEIREGRGVSLVARTTAPPRRLVHRDARTAWLEGPRRVCLAGPGMPAGGLEYPAHYQGSDRPIVVADLALHDDGTLLVCLEGGGANLAVWPDVLKLDEFPDEPHHRWVFRAGAVVMFSR